MTAYSTRMPAGIPGAFSRYEQSTIEAMNFDPTSPPTAFGQVGVLANGKVRNVQAGDTFTGPNTAGIIVRSYPSSAASGSTALGVAIPASWSAADVMKRGYPTIVLAAGDYTAATIFNGAQVYVRTTAATTPTRPVGGFSDQATGTTPLPGAYFKGPPDGFGNVEIAYNI